MFVFLVKRSDKALSVMVGYAAFTAAPRDGMGQSTRLLSRSKHRHRRATARLCLQCDQPRQFARRNDLGHRHSRFHRRGIDARRACCEVTLRLESFFGENKVLWSGRECAERIDLCRERRKTEGLIPPRPRHRLGYFSPDNNNWAIRESSAGISHCFRVHFSFFTAFCGFFGSNSSGRCAAPSRSSCALWRSRWGGRFSLA